MYKFVGLVLLSTLAVFCQNRTTINAAFAHFAERMNARQRLVGATRIPIPEIDLGPKVKYYDALFLGADSLQRTGDCWQEVKDDGIIVEVNYGFHLMAILLPHLMVNEKNMSGYVRIRENSFHLSYTLHRGGEKCLELNEMLVQKIENVHFGASRPEYDGANLEGLFSLVVKPTLNEIVRSNFTKIESTLQALCKVNDFQNKSSVQELVMSLL
ncbi:uncharacterized protein [Halyomorpha halys]|uniref:uncharacterized protein n=1 Tax=Halyomorpha halys TaxID=286706 RepID=UPI0006D5166A|nr:uncharacterized protein LOC106683301 [Halyomorpha halys]XP_014280161.1 uncharacterized protein LOC106683301 [Halyomorpha halys]